MRTSSVASLNSLFPKERGVENQVNRVKTYMKDKSKLICFTDAVSNLIFQSSKKCQYPVIPYLNNYPLRFNRTSLE